MSCFSNDNGPLEFLAPTMSEDMLPCLQPGTIIHLDNHEKIVEFFFKRLRPNITVPYVLITSESDGDSPNYYHADNLATDDLLIKWYGSNPNMNRANSHDVQHKFEPFPLGLSKHHPQNSFISQYLKLTKYANPFQNKLKWTSHSWEPEEGTRESTADSLFVMFGIHKHAKRRQALHDSVCKDRNGTSKDNVSCSVGIQHDTENIYAAASRYLFGLSPPGHGWDCYRTYELLLLGVIPIIESCLGSKELFRDLPVIHVDNLIGNTNRTHRDFVSLMQDYINSDEFQHSNFSGWGRLFVHHWRYKLLLDAGRLKDIITDEHGRHYFQAWRYTTTNQRLQRTLCFQKGNCELM